MLETILQTKREEVAALQLPEPCERLSRRSFYDALAKPRRFLGLIAEVKKASPSKGVIRQHLNVVDIARAYEQAGADAVSVLTDERYFAGHRSYVTQVKKHIEIPVLRKDFIIDRKQLVESVRIGADAILLIGEALDPSFLHELYEEAHEMGLQCLVEVHAPKTVEAILKRFTPKVLGINNRDLMTFHTSLHVTKQIVPLLPNCIIVSESGIHTFDDVQTVQQAGAHAMLVGEALMRKPDVRAAVYELFGERCV
ncbi:MAG: indole-3-glycerol phosphate synthase [Anoxybacillus sp.]|uniref:indole-3-glycerol phosphate synthase TrpC n=1 Tax=Anoxybacillus gonensis TaxID=198467 RepID=UPI00214C614D|nr:indole-3-glycerol phosphate synthase TrpC [Anoxybacillus gonensis]MCQ5364563.1 indole-3-glycerol phosphate synthase TrpC [Anoxybacillus gonensis]GIW50529.1 MAG: indole-3-glycerol phosphate synthase [Anoxybacillus sp.]